MCHGGFFERVLVLERSHTHTCAAHGLRALAPSRVCPASIVCGVQHRLTSLFAQ